MVCFGSRLKLFLTCVAVLVFSPATHAADPLTAEVLKRFPAPEAHQGVAVDAEHFYAITNRAIGKYDKRTGRKVALWQQEETRPLVHLNSGVVHQGKLYCAHSNYPRQPSTSSIEIWDTASMRHIDSHSFGIYEGSCTWVIQQGEAWWVAFAHYNDKNNDQDTTNRKTSLVKFDHRWRRLAAWVFPDELMDRLRPYSCSGGDWGTDGLLYITGHDTPELFVLRLPKAGSTLDLIATINGTTPGQGIAWDHDEDRILFGIDRDRGEVVRMRIPMIEQ